MGIDAFWNADRIFETLIKKKVDFIHLTSLTHKEMSSLDREILLRYSSSISTERGMSYNPSILQIKDGPIYETYELIFRRKK